MRIACSKIAAGRRSGIKKQQPERLIPVGGGGANLGRPDRHRAATLEHGGGWSLVAFM